jgi:hypothetical protein
MTVIRSALAAPFGAVTATFRHLVEGSSNRRLKPDRAAGVQ